MAHGPGDEFEGQERDGEGRSERDRLRLAWRPFKEVKVEGCRVKHPKAADPIEVRLGRYLEADERREAFLVCQDHDMDERPWMLLVYPHALDSEKALVKFVDALSGPEHLGSSAEAWRVARACEAAMGIAREEWVEGMALASDEAKKMLAERGERLRELQIADERRARGLLPEGKPEAKAGPRKRAKRGRKQD